MNLLLKMSLTLALATLLFLSERAWILAGVGAVLSILFLLIQIICLHKIIQVFGASRHIDNNLLD